LRTLSDIPADKQAVLELLVKRQAKFDDLAQELGMEPSQVRDRAQDALLELTPRSAASVDPSSRSRTADYLLGQSSAAEADRVRAVLARDASARAWALSVVDVLRDAYPEGAEPAIPTLATPSRLLNTDPSSTDSRPGARRRVWALAGIAGLLLVAMGAAAGLILDGDAADAGDEAGAAGEPRLISRLDLRPVDGAAAAAAAILVEADGEPVMFVSGKVPPTEADERYTVRLMHNPENAEPVVSVDAPRGRLKVEASLPEDYENYRYLDVSLESDEAGAGAAHKSILRASFWSRRLAKYFGQFLLTRLEPPSS
jgi:hypothetical protein